MCAEGFIQPKSSLEQCSAARARGHVTWVLNGALQPDSCLHSSMRDQRCKQFLGHTLQLRPAKAAGTHGPVGSGKLIKKQGGFSHEQVLSSWQRRSKSRWPPKAPAMPGLASPNPRQLSGVGSRGAGSPCLSLLACFAAGALLWVAWAAERGQQKPRTSVTLDRRWGHLL